jgi:signal transduction histidine kinase
MSETVPYERSTYAVRRVDRLIGRLFTSATLLTVYETFMNAFNQRDYLNDPWLAISLSLVVFSQIANLLNFWLWKGVKWGYLIHGASYVFVFLTWGLQVTDVSSLPADFKPWIWWATGSASMAVGMYLPKAWSIAYIVLVPASWGVLRVTELGGDAGIGEALADSFYSLLFPATIVSLIWLVRSSAENVDNAGEQTRLELSEVANREAQVRERARLDSTLYSSIIGALKLAAKAKDSKEFDEVLAATEQGLREMDLAKNSPIGQVSTIAFFETLENLAHRLDPKCEVRITGASTNLIPLEVASALTDAMAQAIENSQLHAGANAKRKVRLRATTHGVKVVVKDDGFGFRPSRVPKHSLGLRLLIMGRVNSVGGHVFIESKPGSGATIVLTWEGEK